MVLLPLLQLGQAFAADGRSLLPIFGPRNTMKSETIRVVMAAHDTRRDGAKFLVQRLQVSLIFYVDAFHFKAPLDDDSIDVFKALVVRRGEPIERIR
jgi:hypothetical protein